VWNSACSGNTGKASTVFYFFTIFSFPGSSIQAAGRCEARIPYISPLALAKERSETVLSGFAARMSEYARVLGSLARHCSHAVRGFCRLSKLHPGRRTAPWL
jgi:hypothetical protein